MNVVARAYFVEMQSLGERLHYKELTREGYDQAVLDIRQEFMDEYPGQAYEFSLSWLTYPYDPRATMIICRLD